MREQKLRNARQPANEQQRVRFSFIYLNFSLSFIWYFSE